MHPSFRTPAWFYFVLAFGMAWIAWFFSLLGSRGILPLSPVAQLICLFVGSFGPFVGAFVAAYRDGGWPAVREFAGRSLRYRMGLIYFLAAMLLVPVAAGLSMAWLASHGGPPFAFAMPLSHLPLLYVELLLIGGSINEEFGWAYAIDRLQQRYNLLWAAVLLGVIWGCWHIPLFFIVGLTQSFMPFWAFLIFTVALRIAIVWGYASNRQSILIALLFHTASNVCFNLYTIVDRSPRHDERGFIGTALIMLAVSLLIALTARCYRAQSSIMTMETGAK
ncbi:type II CAAX prenyl endopeptidase Rce1 family protein [Dyella acidisoli]|uniref:CPBP family intramembrane metalloprotease n=1 Tax=Dyella acidisoli TaxID=1867834 RepID=A0ABQ5XSI5_9GAMM|nr:CPBP family glutamic-type intramembrane protease [Dyella acidisoli]GLQ93722.1 CPBP family intramembrane metalloprotease [Dyella acidisoli]